MRAPHRQLVDLTKATISAVADDLVIKALDIKRNRNVLASGMIRRLPIADGIQINLIRSANHAISSATSTTIGADLRPRHTQKIGKEERRVFE